MPKFVIEDEFHAEWCGKFSTFESALLELRRRAKISWDEEPNKCPCTGWETCGRQYEIVEFDDTKKPWKELKRTSVLKVSRKVVAWKEEFKIKNT